MKAMKKIVLMAVAAFVFTACQQNQPEVAHGNHDGHDHATHTASAAPGVAAVASPDAPVMSFEQGLHNFGAILQGESVTHEFKFKNTGKTPLIITNATATCGCTVPEIPKAPVKPGDTGVIKVVFNSAGKIGLQDKIVTISSNANPPVSEVHMIGDVKEVGSR